MKDLELPAWTGNSVQVSPPSHCPILKRRPIQRFLCADHPIDLAQWRQVGIECSLVGEPNMIAEALQVASVVRCDAPLLTARRRQRRVVRRFRRLAVLGLELSEPIRFSGG
jgi:hypothetical protein